METNNALIEATTEERMLCDREEICFTIQGLYKTAKCLEDLEVLGLASEKKKQFLKEIESDIEWNEEILQEIDDSLEFVRTN